jgi:hypothetical protein
VSERGHFPKWVFILLVVGLLWAVGSGIYRAGWMQGYETAALTAAATSGGQSGGQGTAPSPFLYGPFMYGRMPWGPGPNFYGPGFGFFPIFPIIGILIVIFIFGGLFRRMAFRHWAGGPGPHPWNEEEMKAWREWRRGWREQQGSAEGQPEDRSAEDRPAE